MMKCSRKKWRWWRMREWYGHSRTMAASWLELDHSLLLAPSQQTLVVLGLDAKSRNNTVNGLADQRDKPPLFTFKKKPQLSSRFPVLSRLIQLYILQSTEYYIYIYSCRMPADKEMTWKTQIAFAWWLWHRDYTAKRDFFIYLFWSKHTTVIINYFLHIITNFFFVYLYICIRLWCEWCFLFMKFINCTLKYH